MAATAVLGGIALAGLGVGAAQSADQKRSARITADRQQQAQQKAEKQLADQQTLDKANTEREAFRARQRVLAQSQGGRKSTILTSPTGLPGQPAPLAGKTLIGA